MRASWIKLYLTVFTCYFCSVGSLLAFEEKESDKPTVQAVQLCIKQLGVMIDTPSAAGDDLECQIPVIVDEEELDTILTQAFDIKKLKSYRESFSSLSSKMTKSLMNARSATCQMTISMPRAELIAVILNKDYHTVFKSQPINCDVKTKAKKIEKVSFSFKPEIGIKNRCVTTFDPHMGEVKVPCKLCRLNMTTRLVKLWVNHIGKKVTPALNQILYRKCPGKMQK